MLALSPSEAWHPHLGETLDSPLASVVRGPKCTCGSEMEGYHVPFREQRTDRHNWKHYLPKNYSNQNKRDDPILNCCFHKIFYFQIHWHTHFGNFLRGKLVFSEHAHPMGLSVIWENGTVWHILEPHHSNTSLPPPPRSYPHIIVSKMLWC